MAIINIFSKKKKVEETIKRAQNQQKHTDVEYVSGVLNNNSKLTEELYEVCKLYYMEKFNEVFFKEAAENKDDIFQNSFIKLWENIMCGKLFVEEGRLKGHDKKDFRGSLKTYLMSIAYLKYLEVGRRNPQNKKKEIDSPEAQKKVKQSFEDLGITDILYGEENDVMLQIISDCISHMSVRCNQIMTMRYLKNLDLKTVWDELPTFKSYNALKNEASRCKKKLKVCANGIYDNYLN